MKANGRLLVLDEVCVLLKQRTDVFQRASETLYSKQRFGEVLVRLCGGRNFCQLQMAYENFCV